MRAYSMDLRERVLHDSDAGGLPAETNAEAYVEVVEGREKAAVISTGE